MKTLALIFSIACLAGMIDAQVTTTISQRKLKVLPNTYTELNLISQDVTNEIKQDTTDISIEYRVANSAGFERQLFTVVALNGTEDYECYLQLINWRVPINSAVEHIDSWLNDFSKSEKCEQFSQQSVIFEPLTEYQKQESQLFSNPLHTNYSNLILIVDNTQQFTHLRGFMVNGSSQNTTFLNKPLFLQHQLSVQYQLSDRWFVMTISFACLDFLALVTVVILYIVFKKKRQEHIEFRTHKEKWLQYDHMYKGTVDQKSSNQDVTGGNETKDNPLEEPLQPALSSERGIIPTGMLSYNSTSDAEGTLRKPNGLMMPGSSFQAIVEADEMQDIIAKRTITQNNLGNNLALGVPQLGRLASQKSSERPGKGSIIKSHSELIDVHGIIQDQDGFKQSEYCQKLCFLFYPYQLKRLQTSENVAMGSQHGKIRFGKQTSGESLFSKESKYKAPKVRSNLFD